MFRHMFLHLGESEVVVPAVIAVILLENGILDVEPGFINLIRRWFSGGGYGFDLRRTIFGNL